MKKINQHKKSNSFMIMIKDTQNNTWQGTIDWIEGHQQQCFRSALEMIKLIDSAMSKDKEQ